MLKGELERVEAGKCLIYLLMAVLLLRVPAIHCVAITIKVATLVPEGSPWHRALKKMAAEKAVEHARSGKGPYLTEYKTFRMALHFSGDPGGYVKPEDLEEWGKRDPIDLCQKKLFDRGILTGEGDKELREAVRAEVDGAVEEAFSGPDPTVEDLFEDIYAQKGVI